ncbi:hypothetical protein EXIGLDRAFT_755205 [Exidia glandulosa HHB12029]|uniref:Uncharacterized protein n=1 Tax=Exidia glandulosa HHB12029 TaxID=1314781 RepID=A0A165C9A7_EXIGL|nr:hypothetical protein EXIGLDRAFT_755205 [Exidia glandulosa HHB12029]
MTATTRDSFFSTSLLSFDRTPGSGRHTQKASEWPYTGTFTGYINYEKCASDEDEVVPLRPRWQPVRPPRSPWPAAFDRDAQPAGTTATTTASHRAVGTHVQVDLSNVRHPTTEGSAPATSLWERFALDSPKDQTITVVSGSQQSAPRVSYVLATDLSDEPDPIMQSLIDEHDMDFLDGKYRLPQSFKQSQSRSPRVPVQGAMTSIIPKVSLLFTSCTKWSQSPIRATSALTNPTIANAWLLFTSFAVVDTRFYRPGTSGGALSDSQDSACNSASAPWETLGDRSSAHTGSGSSFYLETSFSPADASSNKARRRSSTFSVSTSARLGPGRTTGSGPAIGATTPTTKDSTPQPAASKALPSMLNSDAYPRPTLRVRIADGKFPTPYANAVGHIVEANMRAEQRASVGMESLASTSTFSTASTFSSAYSGYSSVTAASDETTARPLPDGHRDSLNVYVLRSRARSMRNIDADADTRPSEEGSSPFEDFTLAMSTADLEGAYSTEDSAPLTIDQIARALFEGDDSVCSTAGTDEVVPLTIDQIAMTLTSDPFQGQRDFLSEFSRRSQMRFQIDDSSSELADEEEQSPFAGSPLTTSTSADSSYSDSTVEDNEGARDFTAGSPARSPIDRSVPSIAELDTPATPRRTIRREATFPSPRHERPFLARTLTKPLASPNRENMPPSPVNPFTALPRAAASTLDLFKDLPPTPPRETPPAIDGNDDEERSKRVTAGRTLGKITNTVRAMSRLMRTKSRARLAEVFTADA